MKPVPVHCINFNKCSVWIWCEKSEWNSSRLEFNILPLRKASSWFPGLFDVEWKRQLFFPLFRRESEANFFLPLNQPTWDRDIAGGKSLRADVWERKRLRVATSKTSLMLAAKNAEWHRSSFLLKQFPQLDQAIELFEKKKQGFVQGWCWLHFDLARVAKCFEGWWSWLMTCSVLRICEIHWKSVLQKQHQMYRSRVSE